MPYALDDLTLMVVEDSQVIRRLLRAILRSLGARRVIECEDGDAAIRRLHEDAVDLAIVDIMMRPMDGIEFIRMVRTSKLSPDRYLPIIVLSGYTEMEYVVSARDAGANEVLAKPFTAQALYDRITAIIEKPRPFVMTDSYFGPDRRRRQMPFQGLDRRKGAARQVQREEIEFR